MADAERILVFIDNSLEACASIKDQFAAAEYYCETKLAANPESEVMVFTMGSADFRCVIYPPTRSSLVVSDSLKSICIGGSLCLLNAIEDAFCFFWGDIGSMKKRMLFLFGGLVIISQKFAEVVGSAMKKLDVAVDFVNFYLGKTPQEYAELNAFVNAANSDDNSHIEHVQPGSDIHEVLSKLIFRKTLHDSMIKTNGRENAKRKNHSLLSGETKPHKRAKGKNHADGDNEHGQTEPLSKGKNHADGDNEHGQTEALSISSGQGEANSAV